MSTGLRRGAALALALALTFGCTSLRLRARSQVEGVDRPIVRSPYAPTPEERCRDLGRLPCGFASNPHDTVYNQCTEHVKHTAASAGANYIHIETPSAEAMEVGEREPRATLYDCREPLGR